MANPRTLTIASPDLQDASSWWRTMCPWNAVREQTPGLSFMPVDLMLSPPTWTPIGMSNGLLMNRPFQSSHLSLIDAANASGVPCVVDFDDCLWNIPRWNGAHWTYGKGQKEAAQISATRAYIVTVTTQALADFIKLKIAPDADIRVIPNALPDWYDWKNVARRKILLWRGGYSHLGDMIDHLDGIVDVLRARPDWHLITVGEDPWWLHERLADGASTHVPRQLLPVFHRWLMTCAASVMMVPLRSCELNRCKSNISWMEGTMAGAAVLAPAGMPEFDRPGVTHYTDFARDLAALLDADQGHRDELVAASRAWIDDAGRIQHVNGKRISILREILDD